MSMIEITNGTGGVDAFIIKLIKTLGMISLDGKMPESEYEMTGLKIDQEKNLVTVYAGSRCDNFPESNRMCFHLDVNENVVWGEDSKPEREARFEDEFLIIPSQKNAVIHLLSDNPCVEGRQWLLD